MSERKLRVIHIVTLITPDGAYGGPLRVAVNQIKELRKRGHDAVLVAGVKGFAELPTSWDGVPVEAFRVHRLVPASGFAGLAAPGMLRWLRANSSQFDVAHVHLARDLITLPAARVWMGSGRPMMTQTHGMVMATANRMAAPLDGALTRAVISFASRNFALTDIEARSLLEQFGELADITVLPNGVGLSPTVAPPPQGAEVEVLFVGRLHPRKRPLEFVRAALDVMPRLPAVRFALVGPDEGEGEAVSRMITDAPAHLRARITWEGGLPPSAVVDRMLRSHALALPTENEIFGMAALEAMSCGLPVLVMRSCGLAGLVEAGDAGVVVDEVDQIADGFVRLLSDPVVRAARGERARRLVEAEFSIEAVASILEAEYVRAIQRHGSTDGINTGSGRYA